jgi:hypothetical protein
MKEEELEGEEEPTGVMASAADKGIDKRARQLSTPEAR